MVGSLPPGWALMGKWARPVRKSASARCRVRLCLTLDAHQSTLTMLSGACVCPCVGACLCACVRACAPLRGGRPWEGLGAVTCSC